MRKVLTILSKVLTNVFFYLFIIIYVGSQIAFANEAAINKALKIQPSEWIKADNTEDIDTQYFKSDFENVKSTKANTEAFTQTVVREGAVLLKNENNALPLTKGSSVNLYSASSVNLVYAGTGSSGTNTSGTVDLKTALEKDDNFDVNEDLWNWYKNDTKFGRGGAGGTVGASFKINEASWSDINTNAKSQSANAAIFVLARNGGEGKDLAITTGVQTDTGTNGNYLVLSDSEKDVLRNLKTLKNNGTIGKIIVLLNSANQVESQFIDNDEFDIDAALWIGDVGSTGIYGVADILVGNASPSGRLADTFWKRHYYNPALTNFGNFKYSTQVFSGDSRSNSYVVYQEGIYVGYRYTETRYEDYVLGNGNAGDFNYEDIVSYPFGYGISYTEFEYSNLKVTEPLDGVKDRVYNIEVTVKNTGSVKGKEVVQLYLQKPYTDYDKAHGIEKAAVELVDFGKTVELEGGQSATVTLSVNERDFASYDADGAMTYILDAGNYYLTVGKDAHDAVNNILAKKGKSIKDGMTKDGNTNLVYQTNKSFDDKTYSTSAVTGAKITNQFDNTDINRYEGRGNNSVTYITRDNWSDTVKLALDKDNNNLNNQVILSATDQMKKDILVPAIQPDETEKEMPTYGSTNTSWQLIDMRGLSYDAEEWDELLDQLTWENQVKLVSDGFRRTVGLSMYDSQNNVADGFDKPETLDHNGATGPTESYSAGANINQGLANRKDENGNYTDPDRSEKPTVYPCNVLVASTYDKELIENYGVAIGEDCLWAGYSGLYGFGLNTHRTPYGGRTFEYYSEDPVLGGVICAAEVKGMASKGCNAYIKHCFLNDQEQNREGVCTWANEQSIREVYLRSFQIVMEECGTQPGDVVNIMTGFNRLGLVWTGHQGFINSVLHGEFGMQGCAVSDWFQTYYMTTTVGVLNGNDIPDATINTNNFAQYKTGYSDLAWALRESAHRILYHTVNSNAMNGIAPGMVQIALPIWWKDMLNAIVPTFGVLFGVSAAFLVVMLCLNKFKPEK